MVPFSIPGAGLITGGVRLVAWLSKATGLSKRMERRPLRYTRSVVASYETEASAPGLLVVPLESSRTDNSRSRPLTHYVPATGAVHLLGSSGSGKSWCLGQYLSGLTDAESARQMGMGSSQQTIPIYAKSGHEHLLDALGRYLLRHGFYRDSPSRDKVRDLISKGGLTLVIDDVHIHLESDERLDKFGLAEIMAFRDRNRIILAGRPHVARNPYGVPQVKMASLDEEARAEIIDHHAGTNSKSYVADSLKRTVLRTGLYNTPQELRLVSEVVSNDLRLPDRLPELFEAVHRARLSAASDRSAQGSIDPVLTRELLGELAYNFLRTGAYEFSIGEAQRYIGSSLIRVGPHIAGSNTAYGVISRFVSDGFLIKEGDTLRFEHDRWQEFFAADFLVTSQLDIGEIESTTALGGVARLAAGLQPEHVIHDAWEFWADFWDRLAESNPALAIELLTTPERTHRGEKSSTASAEEVLSSYGAFLDRYRLLLKRHSGELAKRLPPSGPRRGADSIGLVVARDAASSKGPLFRGYWMGFRNMEEGEDPVKVVTSVGDAGDARMLRTEWGADRVTAWTPEPGVGSPPMRAALRAWSHFVNEAIQTHDLAEPAVLIQERVFYGLHAVAEITGQRASGDVRPFDLAEADALVQAPIRGALLTEQTPMRERWSRFVRTDQLRRDYASIRAQAREVGKIIPPIWPSLPSRAGAGPNEPSIEHLSQLYRLTYASAHELISMNLPSLAASINERVGFPVQVVILNASDGDKKRRMRATLRGVSGQTENVAVKTDDINEWKERRKTLDVTGHTESFATWPGAIDPIRRGAYELLSEAWTDLQ